LVNWWVVQTYQVLGNHEEWDRRWQSKAASGDTVQRGTQKT
jgi:hypothetical protein